MTLCGTWKKCDPGRRKSWCKGAKAGTCLGELEELQGGCQDCDGMSRRDCGEGENLRRDRG